MTTKFELRLIVPAKLVGTIVELVEGEGILISMTPSNQHRASPITRHHEPDMTADQLMQQFLSGIKIGHRFNNVELIKAFRARGYSPKTVSSRVSTYVKSKQIKRLGHLRSGQYERIS